MVPSKMYLAKLSMNSDIYDFYENRNLFDNYLNKVYASINNITKIYDEYNNIYKFNTLLFDKDKLAITGRYSKIFNGDVESYDWEEDCPRKINAKNLSSTVNFYFDLNTQIIVYTASRDFGYKQFVEMFRKYVEKALGDEKVKVVVELLINDEELNEKIDKFKKIEQISFSIIPPNPPNLEEFNNLLGDRAEVIRESQTTNYKETYSSSKKGIKKTNHFRNLISSIKNGYGNVTVRGENKNGRVETITSKDDAPKKININRKDKDNLNYIKIEGEQAIQSIIIEKTNKQLEKKL